MDPVLRFVALFTGGILVVGWGAYGLAKVLPSGDGGARASVETPKKRTARRGPLVAPAGVDETEGDYDEEDSVDDASEPSWDEALPIELEQSIPEAERELESPVAGSVGEAPSEPTAADDEANHEDGGHSALATSDPDGEAEAEPSAPEEQPADGTYWAMTPEDQAAVASVYGAGNGFTGEGAGDGYTGPYASREAFQAAEQALAQALANQPAGAVAVPVFVPLPYLLLPTAPPASPNKR